MGRAVQIALLYLLLVGQAPARARLLRARLLAQSDVQAHRAAPRRPTIYLGERPPVPPEPEAATVARWLPARDPVVV